MKLWKGRPIKKLVKGLIKKGGRNNKGRITVRHRGGGVKRNYRYIDFKRSLWNLKAFVKRIEYDPNRSGFIVLILYENGILSYLLAAENLKFSDIINTGPNVSLHINNAKPLNTIPLGLKLYNIESKVGKGSILKRAAGVTAQLLKKNINFKFVIIKIKKNIEIVNYLTCLSTIGRVSNMNHKFKKLYKAGQSRLLGYRPSVRGVAMNPIDHPHGGGEGKTSGGRCSVSKWGWLTKGYKTVRKKRNYGK